LFLFVIIIELLKRFKKTKEKLIEMKKTQKLNELKLAEKEREYSQAKVVKSVQTDEKLSDTPHQKAFSPFQVNII
jgi:hypothetical protein